MLCGLYGHNCSHWKGIFSLGTQPSLEFHLSFMTRCYSGVDTGLKEGIFKGRGVQLEVKWA